MSFRIPPTPSYERDLEELETYYTKALNRLVRQLEQVEPTELLKQQIYQSQIQQIIHILRDLNGETREWFERILMESFSHSYASSLVTSGFADSLVEAKGSQQFSLMNRNRIESMISDTFTDVLKAHSVMEENMKQLVRDVQAEVLKENVALQRNTATSARDIRARLLREGFSRSLIEEEWKGIVDASGRRWDLTTYSKMAARTKLQQSHVEAQRLQALENDTDLAIISSHGATDACRHFEGMIISLEGRTPGFRTYEELRNSQLIFHPNCGHSVHTIGDVEALPEAVLRKAIEANKTATHALENRAKILKEDNARRYRENKDKISKMRRRKRDRQKGTSMTKRPDEVFKFDPQQTTLYKEMRGNLYKGKPLVDMQGEKGVNIDPDKARDLFGDKVTKEGLLNVFNPDPSKFKAEFEKLNISGQPNLSIAELRIGVRDKDGNYVSTVDRTIIKAGEKYVVANELLVFDPLIQGSGLATNVYFKSEQFYKEIAKGRPVDIQLIANLTVGKYAWTRHGFDFKDPEMIEFYRDQVRAKIESNLDERLRSGEFGKPKVDITKDQWKELKPKLFQEELQRMGYNDLSEIRHAWQFGALDDGRKYHIHTNGSEGHFGKSLMLKHDSWDGVKKLNQGHDSEVIGNLYFERKGVK